MLCRLRKYDIPPPPTQREDDFDYPRFGTNIFWGNAELGLQRVAWYVTVWSRDYARRDEQE